MTDAAIARGVRRGAWMLVHRGVLCATTHGRLGLDGELTAARMATRGGVVAGHSAARLWKLDGARTYEPELVLLPDDTRQQRPGIRLSWRALAPEDITSLHGFPVTTVARTLVDLARRDPLGVVLPLVDSALRQRLLLATDSASLAAASRGRRGAFELADARAESVFESLVRLDLTLAGLAPEVLQHDVRDRRGRWVARVDMAWPSRRLIVELDGFATHGTPEALRSDLRRQNALVSAGWTVLRFTWSDRALIPAAVRAALAV